MRYLLLPLLLFSFAAGAQLPDPQLTPQDRRQIAEAFAKQIETKYVLAEPAKKMAAAIRANIAGGAYDDVTPAQAFTARLTNDARAAHDDRHLRVAVTKQIVPADHDPDREPSAGEKAKFAQQAARDNFGLVKAERLDGNVGYLDIEFFPPLEMSKPTYDAAMAFLANTDALILDARTHRGGEPATVAYLVSWFVPEGTLINEIFDRGNDDVERFRAGKLPGQRYDKKVYVLTSSKTFSGGEELAYDLQALKRATLVGEVTGGGAHPTGAFRIHDRVMAFIPSHQSINPVTKTNWEAVGVKPDVAVPAADALRVAHQAALEHLGVSTPAAAAKGPARDALEAWVKSFNEHDLEARRAWLRANTTLPAPQIEQYSTMDIEIRENQGPFEVVRFGKVTPTSAEAFARHKKSGMGGRIQVEVKDGKITNIGLEPAEVEAKGNPPAAR